MEYGFTPEGNKLLEESRLFDAHRVQDALRLQEETEPNAFVFEPDMPQRQTEQTGFVPAYDASQQSPDMPELSLAPPAYEPQFAVTERITEQHVQDSAPGLIGELSAGLTYDPVETRYEVQKVKAPEKNYDRFTAPEPEMSFEEKLNAETKAYQKQQDEEFERDAQSSPLFRRSAFNKYG